MIDVRLVERKLANGTLSQKDYEKHLKSLGDETSNAEWVALDMDETEISENPHASSARRSNSGDDDAEE